MEHSKFIVSYHVEEPIRIQRVKQVLYKRAVSFVFYILTVTIQGALIIHPFHSGYRYTGTSVNSEDPDEMQHKAAMG